jgi:enoyl-CoA hydratase/carnithine racemase
MLLPWFTSPKIAKRVILLGQDKITAEEALATGLISHISPEDRLLDDVRGFALKMSRVDPYLMRQTKAAINRAYEVMGMYRAVSEAVEMDVQVESSGTAEKHAFLDIVMRDGMKEALRWRNERFAD